MRDAIDAGLSAAPCLEIMDQVFHANAAGQEPRSFGLHQSEGAFTGIIDPHDPPEINNKVTLGVSVTAFLPLGAKVRNPRVSEPSLENEPLLGVSVDSRNLQHRSPPAGRRVSSTFERLDQQSLSLRKDLNLKYS
jgi:hypothetical protein